MYTDGQIYMGLADGQRVNMSLNMSNRHGLIAGASGTGKTITMKAMAESFSDAGVPVFLCDVKGDVSGIATAGVASESMDRRIDKFGIRNSFSYKAYPVCFWDIYQEGGHPVRATISDMGPELLSRILGLTAAQEGVLNIVFRRYCLWRIRAEISFSENRIWIFMTGCVRMCTAKVLSMC